MEAGVALPARDGDEGGELQARLGAAFPRLSEKQQRLARYVLDEEWQVAFSSAAEVGARAGVNAATVVRFAQALGYQGFSELQEAVRARLPRFVTAAERIREQLAGPNGPENILGRSFALQIRNLERTAELVTPEAFERAVDRIVTARRVVVTGAGLGGSVAGYLEHGLRSVGIDARDASQAGLGLALELAGCGRRDLLVVVGFLRYVRDTVEGLNQAVRLGIPTLTMTDNYQSPLARQAGLALIVAAEGVQSTSAVAALALADALVAGVVLRRPQESLRAVERRDALYHAAGLLLD